MLLRYCCCNCRCCYCCCELQVYVASVAAAATVHACVCRFDMRRLRTQCASKEERDSICKWGRVPPSIDRSIYAERKLACVCGSGVGQSGANELAVKLATYVLNVWQAIVAVHRFWWCSKCSRNTNDCPLKRGFALLGFQRPLNWSCPIFAFLPTIKIIFFAWSGFATRNNPIHLLGTNKLPHLGLWHKIDRAEAGFREKSLQHGV